jgi:deoxyribodipyrimidine photo-lyase
MKQSLSIFWFRRDLRLNDNHGLFEILSKYKNVLPIFIFDTNILDRLEDKHDARVEFIHNQTTHIYKTLLKEGKSFQMYYGNPIEIFHTLTNQYCIQAIYTNEDYEPAAIERDLLIQQFAESRSIDFKKYKDHVIFKENDILNDQGLPYKVYTPYKNKWRSTLKNEDAIHYLSEQLLKNIVSIETISPIHFSLESIGFIKSTVKIPSPILTEEMIMNYHTQRDFPYLENATSKLGLHLRFGTISIRSLLRWAFTKSETWINELIWRDFFIQLLFHFPETVSNNFQQKFNIIQWKHNEENFEKWCKGETGYPIVDAGMRELNATGFMHNRVRMITASFLCKHLFIDWRWGERYFASKLLDFELASNVGNWQWCAGTGADAQPYFRIFNPYTQQEKFDPDLTYCKKWVPELLTTQYPKPIIDHKVAIAQTKSYFSVLKKE